MFVLIYSLFFSLAVHSSVRRDIYLSFSSHSTEPLHISGCFALYTKEMKGKSVDKNQLFVDIELNFLACFQVECAKVFGQCFFPHFLCVFVQESTKRKIKTIALKYYGQYLHNKHQEEVPEGKIQTTQRTKRDTDSFVLSSRYT